jgi:hypothetical protein
MMHRSRLAASAPERTRFQSVVVDRSRALSARRSRGSRRRTWTRARRWRWSPTSPCTVSIACSTAGSPRFGNAEISGSQARNCSIAVAGMGISDGIQGLSCRPDRPWLAGSWSTFGRKHPLPAWSRPARAWTAPPSVPGDGGRPLVGPDGGLSLRSGRRGGAALAPAAFDVNPPAETAPMCQVRLLAADAVPEAGVRMLQLLADAPAGPRTAATVRGCRAHPRRVRTRFTVDPMRTAASKVAPPTPRRDRGIGDHPVQRRRPRAERPGGIDQRGAHRHPTPPRPPRGDVGRDAASTRANRHPSRTGWWIIRHRQRSSWLSAARIGRGAALVIGGDPDRGGAGWRPVEGRRALSHPAAVVTHRRGRHVHPVDSVFADETLPPGYRPTLRGAPPRFQIIR